MSYILTTNYLRDNFRIETAVPDVVMQRCIDYIAGQFRFFFSDTYEEIENDASSVEPQNPEIIAKIREAMSYLAICHLLSERYVITGFGIVHKHDEYSNQASDDEIFSLGHFYANAASTILHTVDALSTKDISGCVAACQIYINDYFTNKKNRLGYFYEY